MIYIKQSKKTKQYRAVYTARNGKVLSVTEPEVQKQSIWKNIRANWFANHNGFDGFNPLIVQDDTGKKPISYMVTDTIKSVLTKTNLTCLNITL